MRSRATARCASVWKDRPTRPDLPRRLTEGLRRGGLAALDVLLPPHCLLCGVRVGVQGQLCVRCFRATSFVSAPACARCGVPFATTAQGGKDGLCPACCAAPPAFDRARAALRYDAQARRLLLPLKYADRTELVAVLVPQMARAGALLLREADLLAPVPLHSVRLRARRYNQAALLARGLSRAAGRPAVLDLLVRTRPTENLGDKPARERMAEVAGAFAVHPGRRARVPGARILLIDDVMTSGATANACALALKQAGAAGVDVLTAARVADPRLE
jgi:ComF family protein